MAIFDRCPEGKSMSNIESSAPTPESIAAKALFRAVASHWASGVAVITTLGADDVPSGLTMSAVTSLSIKPMQFLICVDDRSNTLSPLLESGQFCINFLAHDQESIAMRFASKLGRKFNGLSSKKLRSGSILLDGVLAFADCKVSAVHEGGDHRIVIGEVIEMAAFGGEPLTYFAGAFRKLAISPNDYGVDLIERYFY
jgi:3-hydroxy-9,10-secoandrosta-1,3,5(10)-triene-9,17-dione monooxygenase reductase component